MSEVIPPQQQSESKPVLVLTAIAAVATVLVGLLATIPDVPPWVTAAAAGVGAVATAVAGVLTKARVTPWKDVAAKVTPQGTTIAGPAADVPTGAPAQVTVSENTFGAGGL